MRLPTLVHGLAYDARVAPDLRMIDLFAGAFLPGMMLVALYMLWILVLAWLRPSACPPVQREG